MKTERRVLEQVVNTYKRDKTTYFKVVTPRDTKQVANAIKSYAKGVSEKDVVALMDTTVFGSGKTGCILTCDKLYSSHFPKKVIDLEKLVSIKAEKDCLYIRYEDGRTDGFFASIYAAEIGTLLENLLQAAAAAEPEEEKLYRAGCGHYQKKEMSQALACFEKAGEKGHMVSQFNCGNMRFKGLGCEKDSAKAVKWHEMAAEQGHVKSQHFCAYVYLEGVGTGRDPQKALYWAGKAAAQGYEDAKNLLAKIPEETREAYRSALLDAAQAHMEADREDKALACYEACAEQGSLFAQSICGIMYRDGEGTAVNYTKAAYWLRKAAEQGYSGAEDELRTLHQVRGESLATDATKLLEKKEYSKALPLLEEAAGCGHANAMYNCGVLFLKGMGTAPDLKRAVTLFQKAAELGEQAAKNALQVIREENFRKAETLYNDGKQAQSLEHYLTSAELGYLPAQRQCAYMYYWGRGTEPDYPKALHWFETVAQRGAGDSLLRNIRVKNDFDPENNSWYIAAQHFCGDMYGSGTGTAVDHEKALYWYEQAALRGDRDCQHICAQLYREGHGVRRDTLLADYWQRKATEQDIAFDEKFKLPFNISD